MSPPLATGRSHMQAKVLCLIVFLTASMQVAEADCSRWEKLRDSGQKAIDAGQYKRAEQTWIKAVQEAQSCNDAEPTALAASLKRLGEVYMKNEKYPLAESTLKQAAEKNKAAGKEDPELTADLTELAKTYRTVDFMSGVKPAVADLFQQAGVQTLAVLKLAQDQGSRIMLNLSDKFTKKIDNPDVDQVGLDKVISFDIVQEPDGALMISKIKGLKVRAKLWVSIIQSHLKPNDPAPFADVTAQAMGISKTVNCKLPAEVIDPINTFVAKLREFTTGSAAAAATLPAASANTSTTVTETQATGSIVTGSTPTSATTTGSTPTSAPTSTPGSTLKPTMS